MPLQVNPQTFTLTWRFYRVVKADPEDGGMSASTGWVVRTMNVAVAKTDDGQMRVKALIVSVGLDPKRCWVVTRQATKALLEHERLHYIFAALIAAELFDTILALRSANTLDLQSDMRDALNDATDRIDDISSHYDEDTVHGTDLGEQARWQNLVQGWQTSKQVVWP